ncbi:hypothetical protein V2H45_08970 [Tumidithrix elongata RA019]|uniref:Uncharacterized protein n=1 Tax=Tumidithrix elongata BACA0141 TaxID=2716417 RepID=A0AAW9PQU8_9CYAN|nr:hypothetical protein [Tumidithrix elongata RA019]
MSGFAFSQPTPNQYTEEITELQTGSIEQIQQRIYGFFLEIVRRYTPEQVIHQFENLFIRYEQVDDPVTFRSLGQIIFFNQETEFRNTLLRCCYILINNWRITSNYRYTHLLIGLFSDPSIAQPTKTTKLKTLRIWLQNFVNSPDYQSLLLFLGRPSSSSQSKTNWSDRFTSYLLTSQYADLSKPVEQRQIADALSRKIKKQFKFDLAMYTARLGRKTASAGTDLQSNSRLSSQSKPQENPTSLGDSILNLVKTILTRQGSTSYKNLAHQFLEQLKGVTFQEFKQKFLEYLDLPNYDAEISELFQFGFVEKITQFHTSCDRQIVMFGLIQTTCKRAIQLLTIDEQKNPSDLFYFLLTRDNPMPLVIMLLKIILLRRESRLHLETCIAELIKFYSQYPEDECRGFVNFLDILNVTLAIYEDDTDYSIVRMTESSETTTDESDTDDYRVFSIVKRPRPMSKNISESLAKLSQKKKSTS